MPSITFKDHRALVVFHSMAEGMSEVARDNNEPGREALLDKLIQVTGEGWNTAASNSCTIEIDDDYLIQVARSVLENCLDTAFGIQPDDADAEDYLFPGDVVIEPESDDDLQAEITFSQREAMIITWALFLAAALRDPKYSAEDVQAILEKIRTANFHS